MTEKILFRNVHLFEKTGTFDVMLDNGFIDSVRPYLMDLVLAPDPEVRVIDGKAGFLSPGFIDLHLHLEKSQTIGEQECPGLMDAILSFKDYIRNHLSPEDIERRVEKTMRDLICHGTTSIRTHVSVDEIVGTMAVKTLLGMKEKYKDRLDMQIIAMVSSLTLSDDTYAHLDALGDTDILGYGAAPALCDDPKMMIDRLFELAKKHGKIMDLHIDEHDDPNVDVIDYFADSIVQNDMIGQCTGGHLCALSAVNQEKANETISKILVSGMHVVTLPSCNLYLMGRKDKGIVRRGTTRIRELVEAGVNISLASDNIRDPFRPFGNGDMLEEMLLTAQVAQMGTYTDLRQIFRMGTYNPARAMGYASYGVEVGAPADLVLLEAASAEEAILSRATRRYVLKRGKIVCENTTSTHWML